MPHASSPTYHRPFLSEHYDFAGLLASWLTTLARDYPGGCDPMSTADLLDDIAGHADETGHTRHAVPGNLAGLMAYADVFTACGWELRPGRTNRLRYVEVIPLPKRRQRRRKK